MAKGKVDSQAKMILATLDLLRGSGLAGAGINSIVAMSGAPKGSVYHFFPTGKHGLVAAALDEAEKVIGDGFRRIFSQKAPVSEKIRSLFESTAVRIEASNFMKGCPVAAEPSILTTPPRTSGCFAVRYSTYGATSSHLGWMMFPRLSALASHSLFSRPLRAPSSSPERRHRQTPWLRRAHSLRQPLPVRSNSEAKPRSRRGVRRPAAVPGPCDDRETRCCR